MTNLRSRPLRVAALAALLAFPACRADDGGEPRAAGDSVADGPPEPGGTAIIAELSDMSKPMPLIFDSSLDGDLMDVMFMGLTRGAWRDGRLVYLTADESPMAAARRWELTGPDSASIRYHLRSDLVWSDGRPITAHDVKWTYDMVENPAVASPRIDYMEHIDSVRVENDSTVTFHFVRRMPGMLFFSGLPIAPRHAFEGSDPAQVRTHPRMLNPAGGNLPVSGAFMIGSWSQGERVVLVPNPRFSPRPHLEQIVIRVVPEQTTRLVELQTGSVDFTRPVPPDQVEPL
ncbi:MAG TPA: ABC transporter substrate-binding protein, partial [Longimicrobiaceae bacterium]|nr:ABC transporter substrate-binding protein [Longimicrobiaceae bacterium]